MRKRCIGTLANGEEVVVKNGVVYAVKRFDARNWAIHILSIFKRNKVSFVVDEKSGVVIAYTNERRNKPGIAYCNPYDIFNPTIGKAIAVCRLFGGVIPKEIFE